MATTYIEAIGKGFPGVQCHALGDGSTYESLVWDAGQPIPSQQVLDEWIAANPSISAERVITKYQFRKLFTFTERVNIDNFAMNPNLSDQSKAALSTILKDLDVSGEVQLDLPDVSAGIQFLEQVGLLSTGRAAQIIANTPPGQ